MKFQYVAATTAGATVKGARDAVNRDELDRALRAEGLQVLSCQELRPSLSHSLSRIQIGGISALEKVLFARHLALMLKSGLSLIESLDIIAEQAPPRLQHIINEISSNVKNGVNLSKSLSKFPKVFGDLAVSLVSIGESSGTLDDNLTYLATQLEKDYELRQKIRAAMLYPAIIFIATLALGGALSVFVMPKLVRLFEGLDINLPLSTRLFLDLAEFLSAWGVWVAVGIIVLGVILAAAAKLPGVRFMLHQALLNLPIVKTLVIRTNMARSTRTLSILLKSGVPIIEALGITRDTTPNAVYRRELIQAREMVEQGKLLGITLASRGSRFPKMASRMISMGEKTGKLDETLSYLAKFYESEVDAATKNLATVIEPILLIIIGLVVGGLGIAIITPIYQLSGSIGR